MIRSQKSSSSDSSSSSEDNNKFDEESKGGCSPTKRQIAMMAKNSEKNAKI
jgi:hypothetical protein